MYLFLSSHFFQHNLTLYFRLQKPGEKILLLCLKEPSYKILDILSCGSRKNKLEKEREKENEVGDHNHVEVA